LSRPFPSVPVLGRPDLERRAGELRAARSTGAAALKRLVCLVHGNGGLLLTETVWEMLRAMAAFCRRRQSEATPASAPLFPPPGQARSDRQEPSEGRRRSRRACLTAERAEMRADRPYVSRPAWRAAVGVGWCGCGVLFQLCRTGRWGNLVMNGSLSVNGMIMWCGFPPTYAYR